MISLVIAHPDNAIAAVVTMQMSLEYMGCMLSASI
jgi:hypothetical protein